MYIVLDKSQTCMRVEWYSGYKKENEQNPIRLS